MAGQTYQSLFTYGETENALDGFRDSEISKQSANKISNFYISEMGTLQVAKKYKEIPIAGASGQVIYCVKPTKHNFYIVVTATKIFTVNKTTQQALYEININSDGSNAIDEYSNINTIQDMIFVRTKQKVPKIFAYGSNGQIAEIDFFSQTKLPYKIKKEVYVDLYRIYRQGEILLPVLLNTYTGNLDLEINANGRIFLSGLGIEISRIYNTYRTSVTIDNMTGATEGMYFMILRTYNKSDFSQRLAYHIDDVMIDFQGATPDAKFGGQYYTKIIRKEGNGVLNGNLTYGLKEDFLLDKTKIVDICEFQSRLVLATEDKLYFSKTLDLKDFSTGTMNEDGFFIRPSAIEGNQSYILKLVSGNGVYIVGSEGIAVVSYGQSINWANQSIRVASTSNPLPICTLIDDIFYYIDTNGILKAIIPSFENGFVQFANTIVDKYMIKKFQYSFLTKANINNRNVLVVTMRTDSQEFKVYEYTGTGVFRRTTIEFPNYRIIHGLEDNLICGNMFYKATRHNMPHSQLILNLPFIQTYNGGVYLNDFQQEYNQIVLNVLNMDNKYVRGITINDSPIQNIAYKIGNYNIFRFTGAMSIMNYKIDMYCNNFEDNQLSAIIGDETVEIRGINCFLK